MAKPQASAQGVVKACVPRQDGQFLILTRKGQSAVSEFPISEGAQVTIRAGRVEGAVRHG